MAFNVGFMTKRIGWPSGTNKEVFNCVLKRAYD